MKIIAIFKKEVNYLLYLVNGKHSQKKFQSLSEKEIERKVEEYKQKLNQKMFSIIEEEKKKNSERDEKYDQESDPEKKKKLENQISSERTQSTLKLKNMST